MIRDFKKFNLCLNMMIAFGAGVLVGSKLTNKCKCSEKGCSHRSYSERCESGRAEQEEGTYVKCHTEELDESECAE